MRCRIGPRKLRKYSRKYNRVFVRGYTRGNTEHRVDLLAEDGVEYCIYPTRDDKLYRYTSYVNVELVTDWNVSTPVAPRDERSSS